MDFLSVSPHVSIHIAVDIDACRIPVRGLGWLWLVKIRSWGVLSAAENQVPLLQCIALHVYIAEC